jgi:hypothetical protein
VSVRRIGGVSARADACALILERHTAMEIEGQLVDVVTAQMLLAMYRALSPANRALFDKPPLTMLVELGWRHVKAS